MADPAEPLDQVLAGAAIGDLTLPHRVVMGAMHMGVEAEPDAGERLAAFYRERAEGGAGLIVTGGWAVSRAGAGGPGYGFVNEDAGARALERVAAAVDGTEASIALQLFHAGRYAHEAAFGVQPLAPSPLPSRVSRDLPRELGTEEVWEVIAEFGAAAARAVELGFGAVEVMGSEGYLVDQFLSAATNRREDEWGGDPQRRMAFGVELARAVRVAVGPSLPLIFRLTGAELMPHSRSLDEVTEFAAALAAVGVDAINVGIGWHESAVPTVQGPVPAGVWMPWAAAIRSSLGGAVPVIAGNRVNHLSEAEALLSAGATDFVSMSRPFLADAELIARGRAGRPVNPCIACNQACIDRSIGDGRVSCSVNPRAGFELEFPRPTPAPAPAPADVSEVPRQIRRQYSDTPRGRFAVIGGGPAGMEAARALAALGHAVELFEAEEELGGQFRFARLVPGKEVFGETIAYFEAELAALGVRLHLGRRLGEEDADQLSGFDAIVLATGVLPRRAEIPGAELPHVLSYPEAFEAGAGEIDGAERVAIVGAGGIGVDLAHWLSHLETDETAAERFYREHDLTAPPGVWLSFGAGSAPKLNHTPGRGDARAPRVTLMRRQGRIGAGIGRTTKWVWLDTLKRAGVETRTGLAYERITAEGIVIRPEGGEPELIAAERVVIAAGQVRNDALRPLLEATGVPHRVIGGAESPSELNAVAAFASGLRAAHDLNREFARSAAAEDRV